MKNARIFVVSDINVDYIIDDKFIVDGCLTKPGEAVVGGTGFRAASAFKEFFDETIFLGQVGKDCNAEKVKDALSKKNISHRLLESDSYNTGTCNLIRSPRHTNAVRLYVDEKKNANNLSPADLKRLIEKVRITESDYIFLTAHFMIRLTQEESIEYMKVIFDSGANVIFDVVPHNLHDRITAPQFNEIVNKPIHLLISELNSVAPFFGNIELGERVSVDDADSLRSRSNGFDYLLLHYGAENNEKETLFSFSDNDITMVLHCSDTGFSDLLPEERLGFGDRRVAQVLKKILT
jgi:sugar/nucleoside kinase (ribokinase family)